MDYRGGRREEPLFSSLRLVQVGSHRADTGLVLRLTADPGTALAVKHAPEQLGGQLLSSYGGWHVRARQLQCAILSDIRPRQQPLLMPFISAILVGKRCSWPAGKTQQHHKEEVQRGF